MSMRKAIDGVLTLGGIRNGYINFDAADAEFFPNDAFGERSADAKGTPILLEIGGRWLETDIRIIGARAISPRARFGGWLRARGAVPGDVLRLHQVGKRRYRWSTCRQTRRAAALAMLLSYGWTRWNG